MASKLAAMRARIKAKEEAERAKVTERIAEQNKQWQASETQEQEERRAAVEKKRAEKAAEEQAAAEMVAAAANQASLADLAHINH